jgi:hypothetical protein
MRPVETIPGMERGRKMMERMNLTLINCIKFCKCHNVPSVKIKYKNVAS